ncbi:MAG: hypothetical protein ACYDCN_17000 [Bacteroidia bacterium]
MKTFDICSDCFGEHYWREIDYDNVLYVSMDNAICLTLCPACVNKFLEYRQNNFSILQYKQKINSILLGKSKPIPDFKKQNSASLFWCLSF